MENTQEENLLRMQGVSVDVERGVGQTNTCLAAMQQSQCVKPNCFKIFTFHIIRQLVSSKATVLDIAGMGAGWIQHSGQIAPSRDHLSPRQWTGPGQNRAVSLGKSHQRRYKMLVAAARSRSINQAIAPTWFEFAWFLSFGWALSSTQWGNSIIWCHCPVFALGTLSGCLKRISLSFSCYLIYHILSTVSL